jgi:hypothetical protein
VSHPSGLVRLTFSTIHHAEGTPEAFVTNGIATVPELGVAGFIQHFLQRSVQLAVLDFPEEISAKLEIDPVLVYGEASPALDIDTVFRIGNQLSGSEFFCAGQQVKIGNAVYRLVVIISGA